MSKDIKKEIGVRIKTRREECGLSQEQLAEKLEMKRTNIANYEAGRVTPPGIIVAKLADILDISSDYILGRDDSLDKHNDLLKFKERELIEAWLLDEEFLTNLSKIKNITIDEAEKLMHRAINTNMVSMEGLINNDSSNFLQNITETLLSNKESIEFNIAQSTAENILDSLAENRFEIEHSLNMAQNALIMEKRLAKLIHEYPKIKEKFNDLTSYCWRNWKRYREDLRPVLLRFSKENLKKEECLPINAVSVNRDDMVKVPILGNIAAGNPIAATSENDEYITFDAQLTGLNKALISEYFCLKIKGDSMSPNLKNGDVALICKQSPVDNGQIGAILCDNEEATCKRITVAGENIILNSDNPEFSPMVYKCEQCKILGKVIGHYRRDF